MIIATKSDLYVVLDSNPSVAEHANSTLSSAGGLNQLIRQPTDLQYE